MLPTFLSIGAQKSGTSWLDNFLRTQSDVSMPRFKGELMFFDTPERFNEGLEKYRSQWDLDDRNAVRGERTAAYLWCSPEHPKWGAPDKFRQGIPMRVHEALGSDIKFIVQLRNPIDRALSGLLHHRKRGRYNNDATVRDIFNERGILHMGLYGAHLAHWMKVYPRSHFLIMSSDELFRGTISTDQVKTFIGAGKTEGEPPINKKVHEGIGFTRNERGAIDSSGAQIASPKDLKFLRACYRKDVRRLRKLSGKDFLEWEEDFPRRRFWRIRGI